MTDAVRPSVHASAVLVGNRAVLIRGPSGAGKSRLAFDLILAGRSGQLRRPFWSAMTVSISTQWRRIAGPPRARIGRPDRDPGLGIRRCDFVGEAPVGLVVDLAAPDAERLPPAEALQTSLIGVRLPRIPVWQRVFAPAAGCRGADDNREFTFR